MSTQTRTWRPKPRRRSELLARIDASPLLVVLVILVFLSMFPTFGRLYLDLPRFGGVDLPVTQHATPQAGAMREDALQVVVSRDGSIFLAGNNNIRGGKVDVRELPDILRSMLLAEVERRVYLQADTRAAYADVKPALSAIREAGISNVSLMVQNNNQWTRLATLIALHNETISFRTYLFFAEVTKFLVAAIVGTLFLLVAASRRRRHDAKLAPAKQQRRTDLSAIVLVVSVACFLSDFLLNALDHGAGVDPAPLLGMIGILLLFGSIAFALLGRGVGRLTILLANVSIILWLTTIILVSLYIDDLAPIIQVVVHPR